MLENDRPYKKTGTEAKEGRINRYPLNELCDWSQGVIGGDLGSANQVQDLSLSSSVHPENWIDLERTHSEPFFEICVSSITFLTCEEC